MKGELSIQFNLLVKTGRYKNRKIKMLQAITTIDNNK